MLKKVICIVLSTILLVGCTSNSENKNYDSEFLTSLSKGLDKKWKDNDKYPEESAKNYKLWANDELDEVKDYGDKKFKNDKLKELAIRYINVLKEGKEIASNFGADFFEDQWSEHQNKRYELLVEINNISEIPVQDKDGLDEVLAGGKEVKRDNKVRKDFENIINSAEFKPDDSNSYLAEYSAVVENTTEYDIEALTVEVSLFDENDVLYNTTYINVNNWRKGIKAKLDFIDTDDKEGTYEFSLKYYEIK